MPVLLYSAVVIGLFSGLWVAVAPLFTLTVWAGFAGFTTFFASGKHGLRALGLTWSTNLFGILCGWSMVKFGEVLNFPGGEAIAVAIVVVIIVLVASLSWLSFIPGIFIGIISFYAIDGDLGLLVPPILIGAVFGFMTDFAIGDRALASLRISPKKVVETQSS